MCAAAAAASLPEPLRKLVDKICAENGFRDYELEAAAVDTRGGNYAGLLYAVRVVPGVARPGRALSLFAKLSDSPLPARAVMDSHEMYAREVFCYTRLADAYRSLQAEHRVPERERFSFPKLYGSSLTEPEEAVVLEDLSSEGYVTRDRLESMDWEFARAGLRELARFHALSFALEREQPELFDELVRSRREVVMSDFIRKGEVVAPQYMRSTVEIVFEAIEEEYVPALQKFMASLQGGFLVEEYKPTQLSVLAHGDYRISNLMVNQEEGTIIDLVPVDYQMVYHGSPVNDVVYMLFTGSDEAFRREHYEDYIQQYYDELTQALAALHHRVHDVYPKTLYLQHVREKLLYGLGVAVFMMPMMLVTPGQQVRVAELAAAAAPASNALYRERLRGLVRDLARWGVLPA